MKRVTETPASNIHACRVGGLPIRGHVATHGDIDALSVDPSARAFKLNVHIYHIQQKQIQINSVIHKGKVHVREEAFQMLNLC